MAFKRIVFLSASSLFLLTGCGEGYEVINTNTMFPYGNQRTAGSGVAYVLAKMLPEKDLKLESVPKEVEREWKPEVKEMLPAEEVEEPKAEPPKEEPESPVEEPPVAEPTKADQMFHDHGKK